MFHSLLPLLSSLFHLFLFPLLSPSSLSLSTHHHKALDKKVWFIVEEVHVVVSVHGGGRRTGKSRQLPLLLREEQTQCPHHLTRERREREESIICGSHATTVSVRHYILGDIGLPCLEPIYRIYSVELN